MSGITGNCVNVAIPVKVDVVSAVNVVETCKLPGVINVEGKELV